MPQAAYPKNADLNDLCKSLGLTEPSAARASTLLTQAVARWERKTGWLPFLSSGEPLTLTFDPPGVRVGNPTSFRGGEKILNLGAGVQSLTSVTVNGDTKTEGVDFWLRPNNSSAPDFIEFQWPQWGPPQSIEVIAKFGYCTQIPDDAWFAVLRDAACEVIREYLVYKTGGMTKWSQADRSQEYGGAPLGTILADFTKYVESTTTAYKRYTAWLV